MRKIIFIAFVVVFVVFLSCSASEKQSSQNSKEDQGCSSKDWKEYESIIKIWPRLKKEKIESISFSIPTSLEYGDDTPLDFHQNVNTSGYRERAEEVIRWWPKIYKVPKEKLPECIKIIDKAIEKAKGPNVWIGLSKRMLMITKKGKYIIHVRTDPYYEVVVSGREWDSHELGEFIAKYCPPPYKRSHFISPEEPVAAILIFSERKYEQIKSHDSLLVWPPVALLGDKNEAEELLGRSFEPKMIFEGRDWLEKIIAAYEIAVKEARGVHYRRDDVYDLKGWIVFLTQDEFYWKGIGIDKNSVFSQYIIESQQLKAYFDELGLTKEILAGGSNAVRHPQEEKTPQN